MTTHDPTIEAAIEAIQHSAATLNRTAATLKNIRTAYAVRDAKVQELVEAATNLRNITNTMRDDWSESDAAHRNELWQSMAKHSDALFEALAHFREQSHE